VIINSVTNEPTLFVGEATTIAGLTMNSSSTLILNANLTVNGNVLLSGALTVSSAATLTINNGNLNFNAGATIPGTGNIVMTGTTTATTLAPSSGASLPNLTISNPAGVSASGGAFTVTSLTLTANFSISGTLTDSGAFTQSGGTLALAGNSILIAGNVTGTGGNITGTNTTPVTLDGVNQTVSWNNPGNRIPGTVSISSNTTVTASSNWYLTNLNLNSNASLTLQQGAAAAFLWISGTFNDNSKIFLTQLSAGAPPARPATGLSLINMTGTGSIAFNGGNSFDLTVNSAAGAVGSVYTFMTYASMTGALGTTTVHGNAPFGNSATASTTSLTVMLTSLGNFITWTGGTSNNFNTGSNWTGGVVPGANDVVIIKGGPNDPVLSATTTITVKSLQVPGGFLTINGTLTVSGDYSQSAGFITIGSAGQLQIQGNVNRTGGQFIGPATGGAVVLNGTTQSVTDTSGHIFGLNLTVSSGATVTVQPGSVLSTGNVFTNNGTVNLSMASPSSATPLVIGTNLVEGSGSHFNLTLGTTSPSPLTYIFITFGGTETTGAIFSVSPTSPSSTVHHNTRNITVTIP
jgi:hypothetical protein